MARTRQHYARPRAEFERDILRQLGRKQPDVDEAGQADTGAAGQAEAEAALYPERAETRRQLLQAGLNEEQAEMLFARYDLVRIRRQLVWLPFRSVRNHAGYLLASIKNDYEAPRALSHPAPPPEPVGDER